MAIGGRHCGPCFPQVARDVLRRIDEPAKDDGMKPILQERLDLTNVTLPLALRGIVDGESETLELCGSQPRHGHARGRVPIAGGLCVGWAMPTGRCRGTNTQQAAAHRSRAVFGTDENHDSRPSEAEGEGRPYVAVLLLSDCGDGVNGPRSAGRRRCGATIACARRVQ